MKGSRSISRWGTAALVTLTALTITTGPAVAAPSDEPQDVHACPLGSQSQFCVSNAESTGASDGQSDGGSQGQGDEAAQARPTSSDHASGGGSGSESCGWVTVPLAEGRQLEATSTLVANGDLPEGQDVVYQVWCPDDPSDPSSGGLIRWVPVAESGEPAAPAPPSAADMAHSLYEELRGQVPEPEVVTNPPIGTDAIVTVPVFFTVTNWTDELELSEDLLGVTVTVTAEPEMSVNPAEPGSEVVACDGPGVRYDPAGVDLWEQADAATACTHAYASRTGVEGRPVQWASVVTIRWSIEWSASTGEGGSFPTVTQTVPVPRGVSEVQAIVTEEAG